MVYVAIKSGRKCEKCRKGLDIKVTSPYYTSDRHLKWVDIDGKLCFNCWCKKVGHKVKKKCSK